MKYLLLVAVLYVLWRVWKKRQSTSATPPAAGRPEERMVLCAHCGVHLPESEALSEGGRSFCSEAHRVAAASKGQ